MPKWNDDAPMTDIPCPLCQAGHSRQIVNTVWEAPQSAVYQCTQCEMVFIHPTMSEEEERAFYEAEFAKYMQQRGGPGETEPADQFAKNHAEAVRRLNNLKPYLRPDMRVLEIGSSTGFVLDALSPQVSAVTGIEPGQIYREYAQDRGIRTVADLSEVAQERFDLILAYYVVEHLRHPIHYLARLREMLNPSGRLALEVPNVDDALVRFYQLESFDRFYWQKAHYFNYSHRTMTMVLEQAGFTAVQAFPEQRYDISNHVHWLLKGQPGGKGKYTDILDDQLNREYARCLKQHWLCDTVFAVASKS